MNGLARRVNESPDYGTSINNIYKMISYKVPEKKLHGTNRILEKLDPFDYTGEGLNNIIVINKGSMFTMRNPDDSNKIDFYEVTDRIKLRFATDTDESIITDNYKHGQDYFVYLIYDNGNSFFKISINESAPYKDANTPYDNFRLIGGFHVGSIRKTTEGYGPGKVGGVPIGSDGTEFGTDWKKQVVHSQIVHNSVWDLGFKSKSGVQKGFAYTRAGLWESIYQITDGGVAAGSTMRTCQAWTTGEGKYLKTTNGPTPESKYGCMPLTGTEGTNNLKAFQLAMQMGEGMRLPTYHEWMAGAYGTPQYASNEDCWGSTSSRKPTGLCAGETAKGLDSFNESSNNTKYAISADNITQCAGNIWEYLDDITFDIDGGGSSVSGDLVTSWGWEGLTGSIEGDFYGGVRGGIAGGRWLDAARCGGVTFLGAHSVLCVYGYSGCRFVSPSACSVQDI